MKNLPEPSQFESRLPDNREYWNDLAARIVDSAEPLLRDYQAAQLWWHPLARWGPAIAVAAAAAAIVAVATVPDTASGSATPRPSLEEMISAGNPIAQAVFGGESATNVSTILLVESGTQP